MKDSLVPDVTWGGGGQNSIRLERLPFKEFATKLVLLSGNVDLWKFSKNGFKDVLSSRMAEDELNTKSACGSWHCGVEVAEHVACSMRILKN